VPPAGPAEAAGAADASAGPARDRASTPPPTPPPTHTTTSWWEATTGGSDAASHAGPEAEGGTRTRRASATWTAARGAQGSTGAARVDAWSWLDDERPSLTARIGRAVLGWAPIALGVGWLVGEVSGCGRFSADCDPALAVLPWFVQLGILGLLLALPRLATVAAVAGLAAVAAAIPGALLLSATSGGPDSVANGGEGSGAVLGALLVAAWLGGAAVGVARAVRRRSGPVS
jgi:hypothetical protein